MPLRRQPLELIGVQDPGLDREGVSAGPGADAIAAKRPAQPRDMDLEPVAVHSLLAPPHLVEQLISRNWMTACQCQRDQQGPRPRAAHIQYLAVVSNDFQRPENPDLHASSC